MADVEDATPASRVWLWMNIHTSIGFLQWWREPQPQPRYVAGPVAPVFADAFAALTVDVAVGYQRPVAAVGDMQGSFDCNVVSCLRCC